MVAYRDPRDIHSRLAKARYYKVEHHGAFLPDKFFGPDDRFLPTEINTGIARLKIDRALRKDLR